MAKNETDSGNVSVKYKVRLTKRVNLGFWKGCGIIVIALLLTQLFVPTVVFGNIFSFFAVVVLIWLMNKFLKPLLILFTLPFIMLTLGAGIVVMDALLIWFASGLIPGIQINSFWTALLAGLLVELISWGFTIIEAERIFKKKSKNGDYIDV